jgi:20S proteasome alpha/beta subunit
LFHHNIATITMTVVLQLSLLLLFLTPPAATASKASHSYNAYQYDMTTPQFTPDGRLLQVEYASRAAEHSSCLLVHRVGDSAVLLCGGSRSPRMVAFHNYAIIGLSGILSDNVALLQQVYQQDDSWKRQVGSTLTAVQVATHVAQTCQQHAFGGGLRPFGATMVVVGLDGTMYQMDPSGSVVECNEKYHLIGGTQDQRSQLITRLQDMEDSNVLTVMLPRLVRALLDSRADIDKDAGLPSLQVSVLSPKLGVHQLTETQIQTLLQQATEKP